jgi:hypothetical protein
MAHKRPARRSKPCTLAIACDGKDVREPNVACTDCQQAQRKRGKPVLPKGLTTAEKEYLR